MDRKILKADFSKVQFPAWRCPTCKSGTQHPKKDSFLYYERYDSKKAHKHEDWEPEWIEYTYTFTLECSNKSCREMVTNTGTGSVEGAYEFINDYPEVVYQDTFIEKDSIFEPLIGIGGGYYHYTTKDKNIYSNSSIEQKYITEGFAQYITFGMNVHLSERITSSI